MTCPKSRPFQDGEPVTLDAESFLNVLPGPLGLLVGSVGDEVSVDDIGDPPLEGAQGFLAGLALVDLAVEVDPAGGVGLADLGDSDHVDRPVQLPVAAQVDPMPWPWAGGGFARGGRV